MRICLLFFAGYSLVAANPSSVTFYKDIAPITYTNCAPCHRAGEAGPFALLTFNDVKKRAAQIGAVTRSRYMPPWLPDPASNHFADERRLTDAQVHTIQQWITDGLQPGSPADAPPEPQFTPGWQLGPPDLIVKASRPFTVPNEGKDSFWNFVLRNPVDRTRFVKAVEIRPGNKRLVHHANLLLDRSRTSRSKESSPGAGFEGMDLDIESDTFEPDSHFLFWKPGSVPYVEPEGLQWRLDKGDDLVLNVHFQATGKRESIQPEIGLYFSDRPPSKFPMLMQLEHDGNLDIPAGDSHFEVEDSFKLPIDVDVLSVYPHAHYLGKLLEGYATLPDGSRETLVRIPDWDLNWQGVFRYPNPLFLPRGTVISMRYQYDNSAANPRNPHHPPQRVRGGNQSTDEMGHLWLQVLPRSGSDSREVLQEALMRHRLEKYPADFSAHFNLGALLLARHQPEAAVPLLRDALRVEPDQPVALNALGAALLATGKSTDAAEEFQHALRVDARYTNARYNLANLLAAGEQYQAAVDNFRQVAQESPDDAVAREHFYEALTSLANSLIQDHKLPEASATLKEALTIHPDNADLHNNLGVLLARQGDRPAAAIQFELALKSDPQSEAARRNLQLARGH